MLGILAEGMKKVVKGIKIILMDILSEVDPEVFGSLEESKDVNEKQNLILEASSNKKMPTENLEQNNWTNNKDAWHIFLGIGPPYHFIYSSALFRAKFFDD